MSDPFIEIAEFAGKACGIIARDMADFSRPLGEAFRRGWDNAWEEQTQTTPAGNQTPQETA